MSMRALMVRALTLLRNQEGRVRLRFKFEPLDVVVLAVDEKDLVVKLPTNSVVSFQVAEDAPSEEE